MGSDQKYDGDWLDLLPQTPGAPFMTPQAPVKPSLQAPKGVGPPSSIRRSRFVNLTLPGVSSRQDFFGDLVAMVFPHITEGLAPRHQSSLPSCPWIGQVGIGSQSPLLRCPSPHTVDDWGAVAWIVGTFGLHFGTYAMFLTPVSPIVGGPAPP
jgi:hypothetical protein